MLNEKMLNHQDVAASLFRESDYALWMDQLEGLLMDSPGWRDLLTYQNISVFDSAYSPFYWGMLEAYRKAYRFTDADVNTISGQNNHPGENILEQFIKRKISFERFFAIAARKLRGRVSSYLPQIIKPDLPIGKRALVVRAFRNVSAFPVLSAMKEGGWNILFTSWNENLEMPVKKIGVPYLEIKNFYRQKYQSLYKNHQQKTRKLLASTDCFLPGHLLAKASQIPLEVNAYDLLLRNIVQVRTDIDIYLDLIERFPPDVLVLFNENSLPGRTMANVARMKNIPSVTIQHGLFIGYVYRRLATDKMIVWGETPRKFWLDRGCKPDQVISVGAFAHEDWIDKYVKDGPIKKAGDRQRILVLGQNPAAFISQPAHQKTVATIFRAVQALPQYHFVVRPHPRESQQPYINAYEKLDDKKNIEVNNDESVEDAILRSDMVITVFSTAGIEAMLLGKPVLVLDLTGEPPLAPYVNATKFVDNSDFLPAAITEILENTERYQELVKFGKGYVENYLGPTDGQAKYRAAKIITETSLSS